ncbi:major facilitator superfamily transporter [Ceratobasidium sp. AG-Ba]|nr:major facilitator superfamily transporter [Ceratobasidium sp. AG-Ba]
MDAREHSLNSTDQKSTHDSVPHEPTELEQQRNDAYVEPNPGVARVEALHRHLSGPWRWMLYLSIAALAYIYSLDQNTTSNYLPYATSSFGQHSFIGTIGTAEGIITAVGKPVIAKIADLASRPFAYIVVLIFYVVGYILVACAQTVYSVAGGMVLYTVGHTGLDLITDIIIADITPLKWRGFATALPSAPFIINAFISAEIVTRVVPNGIGWRWGFGMFAIIVPAVMTPAIVTLFAADRRAKKAGELAFGASLNERRRVEGAKEAEVVPRQPLWIQAKDIAIKMDLFGLVLIGFIFGLILFPISLAKTVNRGWANPSIIAMIVVGVTLIPAFIVWERFFAPVPIMPRRIITNRAFLCAVGIDFFYNFSGFLRSLYLSSFVWVVTDWNTREWVYFNNTMTITLCVFGMVGGLILRYTRRYKFLQISGLCIRILGLGLMVAANGAIAPTVQLVWTQILIGIGGAFSVVGSRVGSQASVPHEDLASVIALLSLWSSLGTSVGSATATAIWTSNMPDNLAKYLPGVPAATIKKLYGSIKSARDAAPNIRAGVIQGKAP